MISELLTSLQKRARCLVKEPSEYVETTAGEIKYLASLICFEPYLVETDCPCTNYLDSQLPMFLNCSLPKETKVCVLRRDLLSVLEYICLVEMEGIFGDGSLEDIENAIREVDVMLEQINKENETALVG